MLVEAVAAVGVDVNLAASRPHLAGVLAFAPGLGPRKADALLRALGASSRGAALKSRAELRARALADVACAAMTALSSSARIFWLCW